MLLFTPAAVLVPFYKASACSFCWSCLARHLIFLFLIYLLQLIN